MTARFRFWATMLARCWRTAPGTSALLTGLIIAESAAVTLLALSVRSLVDGAQRHNPADILAASAGAAVCLLIVNIGLNTRQSFRGNLSERIGLTLDQEILGIVAGLPRLDHLEQPAYLDRVSLALGGGPSLVAAAWAPLESTGGLIGLGSSVVLLTRVHPALLVILVFAPVPLLVNRRAQNLLRASALAGAESARREEHLFGLLTSPAPAKEIMIYGAAPRLMELREQQWRAVTVLQQQARLRSSLLMSAGWSLFTAAYIGGLAYTAYLTSAGLRSAGDMLLAITLAGQLRRQVEQTVQSVGDVVVGAEALEPYLWLLRYYEEETSGRSAPAPDVRPPAVLRQGITLDEVSFRYPEGGRDAVDSVSVHLPAGSTVAVVGEYGSGKTSLVKLLCRFYPPHSGRITVDGTDLADLAPDVWNARLTVAFQDFGRYRTTLSEAVGIGDLERSGDGPAVQQAIRDGDAQAVVDQLPDGVKTRLGHDFGGVDLSEGQWQRVALARSAMRTRPLLLILDEPTAALDAPSEYAVFRRHRAIARRLADECGTITLIVSHRLSTVRDADLILVMEQGRLAEAGDHQSLLARGGLYAEFLAIHDTRRAVGT
jgi:ATP-binding cassette subfamily B protein